LFSFQLNKLNPSRPPIKPDGNLSSLNNYRHFARTFGMLEHGVELIGFGYDVDIFDLLATLGIRFTSCPGVGSGILAED
jgi:hypothetical protein